MRTTAYRLFCLSARSQRLTELRERVRDGEGQFAPKNEGGGADPHAVAAAYGPEALSKNPAGPGPAAMLVAQKLKAASNRQATSA